MLLRQSYNFGYQYPVLPLAVHVEVAVVCHGGEVQLPQLAEAPSADQVAKSDSYATFPNKS